MAPRAAPRLRPLRPACGGPAGSGLQSGLVPVYHCLFPTLSPWPNTSTR
ncbi:Uncharacterised protein [Bordetella pertussis]|nr:Uncharacterised protein [Bordetella pertussis]